MIFLTSNFVTNIELSKRIINKNHLNNISHLIQVATTGTIHPY